MVLENTIVKSIIDYLNNEVDCCTAEKVHGSKYQLGRADINGCWKGRSFRIEVKSEEHGNRATKLQLLNLKKWMLAGAIATTAYSLKEVKEVIGNDKDPFDSVTATLLKEKLLLEIEQRFPKRGE